MWGRHRNKQADFSFDLWACSTWPHGTITGSMQARSGGAEPHWAIRYHAVLVDGLGLSGKTKALVDLALGLDRARFEPVLFASRTEAQSAARPAACTMEFRCPDAPIEDRLSSPTCGG